MKFSKKITALFIAVMMVVSAIPFTASAASEPYLTFTGTDSFSIKTNNSAKNWNGTLEYSTDANTWTTWNGTQISSVNNVLYLRGTGNTQITGSNTSNRWVITTQGTVACSGDIRTLLDYAEPESSDMGTYCFSNMFKIWTSLTAAPELPATILAGNCYSDMFAGCTSLTTAPELPATTLAADCYSYMFYGCANLTTAPELPATSLAENCYRNMFNGCTSLTTPSKLPATDLTSSCYRNMFNGCTGIKLSTEQTAEYSIPYSIPKEGTGSMADDALTNMFSNTGGTFTGTPTINTTYYIDAPSAYAGYVPAEADDADALAAKVVKFNGMDWYLIEDNSTSETEGTVTLFAADNGFGLSKFSESNSNAYSSSKIKAALDAMTVEGGAFADVAGAIVSTALEDVSVTGAKLYLLSTEEVNSLPANVLKVEFTGGDCEYSEWWLRSTGNSSNYAALVDGRYGYVYGNGYYVESEWGVRPALKLDLSKVVFDSSSKTFAPVPTSTVSFTKVTDASQITAENISTCSMEEAAAWIVANWDDIFDGEFIDVAYYNSSTGCLDAFSISSDNNKKSFEDYYENFIYSDTSADNIKNWFETYGDTVYLCTPAAPAEPNNGASITVAETISENFYLDDEFYGEDSFITVNYNHNSNVSETDDFRTDVVAMNSLPELDDSTSEYNGARKFSVVQAPAQATEGITINVYPTQADAEAGTNAIGEPIEYSVYSYCRQIITGDYAENLKALAKSTLDYAAAAQDYFDYNTENMATKDATGGFYNNVAGADLSSVAGVSAAPSCITKASVVVKSDLEINLFSLTPIEVTGASMDATKGKDRFAATSYQSGDYYVVHIAGIEPANMDNTITVNTSEGDIVMTANAIIKLMLNSNDAKLVTLAKAMYLYGVAANTYFD